MRAWILAVVVSCVGCGFVQVCMLYLWDAWVLMRAIIMRLSTDCHAPNQEAMRRGVRNGLCTCRSHGIICSAWHWREYQNLFQAHLHMFSMDPKHAKKHIPYSRELVSHIRVWFSWGAIPEFSQRHGCHMHMRLLTHTCHYYYMIHVYDTHTVGLSHDNCILSLPWIHTHSIKPWCKKPWVHRAESCMLLIAVDARTVWCWPSCH
jgi:hypothetical protein